MDQITSFAKGLKENLKIVIWVFFKQSEKFLQVKNRMKAPLCVWQIIKYYLENEMDYTEFNVVSSENFLLVVMKHYMRNLLSPFSLYGTQTHDPLSDS